MAKMKRRVAAVQNELQTGRLLEGEDPCDPMCGDVDEEIDTGRRNRIRDEKTDNTLNEAFMEEVVEETLEGTATDVETGGLTAGGMSEDMTAVRLGGAKRQGGPTGGDIDSAGEGGGGQFDRLAPTHAQGVDKPIDEGDTGIARKVAAQNTTERINREESYHG